MKKIVLLSLAATAAFGATAQSKLDLSASMLVNRAMQAETLSRSGEHHVSLPSPVSADDKVAVVVTFAPGEDAAVLEERGYEVLTTRDDMAIVRMSVAEMQAAAALSQIKNITLGTEARKLLYQAKTYTGVTTIHEGGAEVGGKAYDGTGVIVGLMDGGLDINHPNFLNADGTPRASRLFVITGNTGTVSTYDTPSRIAGYTTDDSNDTHGTHVLGCMAGSFSEPFTQVAFLNRLGRNQIKTNFYDASTDYRGAATGADIAACCGTTEGTNILLAAEKIYSYAKSQGKPAVMNISLGHNYGPHDGTDANSRYLESIGKDMIICVSAGNEGSDPISIHKDFTASDNQVKTFPSAVATANGIVDIWGADNSIYKVTFQIINKNTGDVAWSYTVDKNLNSTNDQSTMAIITSSTYTVPYYIHSEAFDKAFGTQAAAFISSNVDANNNRYNVQMQFQTQGGNNGFLPAIVVEGAAGKSVDLFCAGNLAFYNNSIPGFTAGNATNSINGIATAKNIIAVGAYVNAVKIPTLSGLGSYRGIEVGEIAPFSSYGTSFDGRVLPHVAGPGQAMLSSLSSYYTSKLSANDETITQATGRVEKSVNRQTRNYYWGEMSGTSMSSPFVAGVIALWLQADPSLTYDDVLNTIKYTSTTDAFTQAAPHRFGAGRINALAGLKHVLNPAGVADIAIEASDFVVTPTFGRGFEIFAAGASGVRSELYSMNGMLVASASASGDTAVLDAETATPGIYILRSTTESGRTDSRKVVLK